MQESNHSICDICWIERNTAATPEGPSVRVPVRLREPERERCCYCGKWTKSGIYVRGGRAPCGKVHR